jgi:hypothetical protein
MPWGVLKIENPPHGSVEIVQILPTKNVPQNTDAARGGPVDPLIARFSPRSCKPDQPQLVVRSDPF